MVLSLLTFDSLGELLSEQLHRYGSIQPDGYILANNGVPIYLDTFSRRLRRIYQQNGFPADYHLHTLRHFVKEPKTQAGNRIVYSSEGLCSLLKA